VSPRRHGIVSAGVDAILRVLPELLDPAEGWALMGGTALAEYYLGHRQSEDLDLFTLADGAVAELSARFAAAAPAGVGRVEIQVVSPTLRRIRVRLPDDERVKVELIQDAPPRFEEPTLVDDVPVASLTDIAVGKLGAFVTRDEPRDLIDLWGIERLAGTPLVTFYPFLFEKDPGLAAYPQAVAEAWHRHGRRSFSAPLILHIQPDVDLRTFCKDQQRALVRFLRERALEPPAP
jgi:Nucleotidyl transferase AbiEii toxin, Type IV TA system